ncbi:MAG: O-antigen ligase family protein [Coriobacteriia bacterium]|nr:O-antigen ligase family protein [Coriobacteriia bacterium]
MNESVAQANRPALRDWWPPLVVATALVAPVYMNSIAHRELFMMVFLIGAATAGVSSAFRRTVSRPIAAVLFVFLLAGYACVHSLFAPEPYIALFGAYDPDASALTWITICAGIVWLTTWATERRHRDHDGPVVALLIVISLYATASGVAAWQWGSTDGMGGPPSGLTPNSQYQLQLLAVGLGAALAWGLARRRSAVHVGLAAAAAAVIVLNIGQCRSAVSPLAALIALAYCAGLLACAKRSSPRVFASISTLAIILVGGLLVSALLIPATSSRTASLLDALGNGRGTLWASAARLVAEHPVTGVGLSHSTLVSRWSLRGGALDATTTTDAHNAFLTLSIGLGLPGLLLALAVLYWIQYLLLQSFMVTPMYTRPGVLALVGGAVAVMVYAQFAFVYPVAWTLAAGLIGVVIAQEMPLTRFKLPARAVRLAACLALAAALVLTAVAWAPVQNRSDSLLATYGSAWSTPEDAIMQQVVLIRQTRDVMPAESAVGILASWMMSDPVQASLVMPKVAERADLVRTNMGWDARLCATALRLWAAQADAGDIDFGKLYAIAETGMTASPASGLWATTACDYLVRYGGPPGEAARFARMVRTNGAWWEQAKVSADPQTIAVINRLAGY